MVVPTEPGYPLAVLAVRALGRRVATALAEQIVDNPVPQGRRGGGGGLQGLRAGQGSTAAGVEQIIDIPVPQGRRRSNGSPQGSLPGRGSTANVEQIVARPARGGVQGFLPGQGSSSRRFLQSDDEGFQGVFSHFSPWEKSAHLESHSGSELLLESSPSTPAAQLEGFFSDAAGVWMQFPNGRWKLLGSDPEVWRPG